MMSSSWYAQPNLLKTVTVCLQQQHLNEKHTHDLLQDAGLVLQDYFQSQLCKYTELDTAAAIR